jgi:hypothetical protein
VSQRAGEGDGVIIFFLLPLTLILSLDGERRQEKEIRRTKTPCVPLCERGRIEFRVEGIKG